MRTPVQKQKRLGTRTPSVARLILPLLAVSLAAVLCSGCSKKEQAAAPPDVEVANVVQQDVPVVGEWIGTTAGMVNAVIRAQVQGYLTKQNYKEGDVVKKGQVLFEIDPRTFRATLDQAKGDLARQEAMWETAKANLTRIKPLAEQNAVSKKDLDDAVGREQSAHSSVMSAKAAVDKARLDLNFTRITSPIDGIAGVAKTQLGNLVGPGQVEELTTVSTVNPIKVYVQVSEQEYLRAAEQMQKTAKRLKRENVELILADGSVFPQKGAFAFADREVDPSTGTMKVAILFPNPGNVLRPGLYAKVRAVMQTIKGALVVPQRAVNELQGNFQVAVVGTDNKVAVRTVKPGAKTGSLVVITDGLQPGERIVVEGLQKVKDGMTVNPKMASPETPAAQPAAQPEEKPTGTPAEKPVAGHEQ